MDLSGADRPEVDDPGAVLAAVPDTTPAQPVTAPSTLVADRVGATFGQPGQEAGPVRVEEVEGPVWDVSGTGVVGQIHTQLDLGMAMPVPDRPGRYRGPAGPKAAFEMSGFTLEGWVEREGGRLVWRNGQWVLYRAGTSTAVGAGSFTGRY